MWYLILKDVEDWIASKDIQFFHRGIHLLPERWQKVINSDGLYFEIIFISYLRRILILSKKFFKIKYNIVQNCLSQWLYWKKNSLKRSTGHILDVSVNANSFCVQCSVMGSAALTRDRVLHFLPRQVKFYFLSFHVIDIKWLLQRNKLLYYLERCHFTEYVC